MAKSPHGRAAMDEGYEALARLYECQNIIRSYAPRVSVTGAQALIFIAMKTFDREKFDLPTNSSLAEALGVARSTASRILSTLGPSGRTDATNNNEREGHDMIETNDWIGGLRVQAFVLTPNGRKCITEIVSALIGREFEDFQPHDLNSLFKNIFASVKPRK